LALFISSSFSSYVEFYTTLSNSDTTWLCTWSQSMGAST